MLAPGTVIGAQESCVSAGDLHEVYEAPCREQEQQLDFPKQHAVVMRSPRLSKPARNGGGMFVHRGIGDKSPRGGHGQLLCAIDTWAQTAILTIVRGQLQGVRSFISTSIVTAD